MLPAFLLTACLLALRSAARRPAPRKAARRPPTMILPAGEAPAPLDVSTMEMTLDESVKAPQGGGEKTLRLSPLPDTADHLP